MSAPAEPGALAVCFAGCTLIYRLFSRAPGDIPAVYILDYATLAVFLVMNLFTCVWNPVTVALISNESVRSTVSSIVTAVVTGGVAMVIIFAVDNKIFAPDFGS